ncbi:MAG TPA: hypothetical protein DCM39_09605 [Pantoea sp.]|jgi:hypothetical protein|nr:hypothetical protein [Pantoea sp.]
MALSDGGITYPPARLIICGEGDCQLNIGVKRIRAAVAGRREQQINKKTAKPVAEIFKRIREIKRDD